MYFLEDEFIGLRSLCIEDINGEYKDWLNDSLVCKFNGHHKYPMTREMLVEFVNNVGKDNTRIVFAVDIKASEEHIGNISLQQIDYMNQQAEIAFLFGKKEIWGHGYATRAARLLINHGFYELNLHRIYFGTAEDNVGMQRVGEKLNFKMGGISREAVYKNGKYVDLYRYDLLREEWVSDNLL